MTIDEKCDKEQVERLKASVARKEAIIARLEDQLSRLSVPASLVNKYIPKTSNEQRDKMRRFCLKPWQADALDDLEACEALLVVPEEVRQAADSVLGRFGDARSDSRLCAKFIFDLINATGDK